MVTKYQLILHFIITITINSIFINRLLLEALDELEVAFTHPQAKKTDGNHIFLNFVRAHHVFTNSVSTNLPKKMSNVT